MKIMKFKDVLDMITDIDEYHLHIINNDIKQLDEDTHTVHKVQICVTCNEESWITTNVDNPLLTALFDLDVEAFRAADERYTIQVWLTDKSVIDLMRKAYGKEE